MPNDPIVEEIHRIRQQLLDEFDGDMDALAEDMNRRLYSGEYGDVKIVSYPPKRSRTERAWMAEIQRRFDAIDRGEAKLIDHDEVVARFTRRFGRATEGQP